MATVSKWNPFGVALDITATAGTVTRTSATTFTVVLNVSWETYYSGAQTNYGMSATSGGVTKTISAFNGTKRSSGSASFTGTYSISGNGAATKTITVTFNNFNTDNNHNASKSVNLAVSVPALASWTVSYNANGGTGAPAAQTKWKDQSLTLSSSIPARTGYTFKGWATSASGAVVYASGASYTANAAATLYAVWQANAYTVTYNANGGTGAPAAQTKYHGTALAISSTIPTRTNYNFLGWATTATATTATYSAGASYTANAAITLYAVWELAYVRPIISNLLAYRCNTEGVKEDGGVYVKYAFTWKTTYAAPTYKITISAGDYTESMSGKLSGKSGKWNPTIITFEKLLPDTTYTFKLEITDSGGYSFAFATLSGVSFPIDVKKGEEGEKDAVSIGKPAEVAGLFDVALDAKFNNPVYGNVLGLNKLPAIPEGAELNDYITTGAWAIYSNAVAATITCGGVLLGTDDSVPPARACRFEVNSATGEGIRAEQWSYLRQRLIPYNSSNPVFEREITRNDANVWTYYNWWESSLTPAAADKVYSKAAITIALSNNTTLGALNTYTPVPFNTTAATTSDRLIIVGDSVRIGANISYVKASGQLLIDTGTLEGNRHARIQKISGGTTTSHAWACVYAPGIGNTLYPFTPVIIPVKEGDTIRVVYYTGDTADSIAAGSSANGRQSYLTVEEL